MKIKLVRSDYNKENGVSYARIRTNLGEFDAISILNDEDKEIESSFAGCEYAETKAIIRYYKAKKKKKKEEIRTLKSFEKVLSNRKDTEYNSREWRTLRKEIFIKQEEVQKIQNRIDDITKVMLAKMNNREKIINKMINK